MNTSDTQSIWPGLEIVGPSRLLADVEDLLAVVFADGEMLGSARETWHAKDPSRGPDRDEDCRPAPEAPGILQIWLAQDVNMADARGRLVDALERLISGESNETVLDVRPLATPDEDWATSWREFFRPIRVSSRMLILPAWWKTDADGIVAEPAPVTIAPDSAESLSQSAPDIVLRIEPGQAFGSGTHATTRLTLRAAERSLSPGARVLDFGAGSGILAFAAIGLGAASVVGVEIDLVCLDNFRENAALNRLQGRVEYRIGSTEALRDDERFNIILCNVLLERVADSLPALASHLAPRGRLLLSGFLEEQRPEAEERLRAAGLVVSASDREEEWGLVEATTSEDR